MKAVKIFKSLLEKKRLISATDALGKNVRTTKSPLKVDGELLPAIQRSRSFDLHDRRNVETILATEGVHHDSSPQHLNTASPMLNRLDSSVVLIEPTPVTEALTPLLHNSKKDHTHTIHRTAELVHQESSGEKGHAHNPLDVEPPLLGIGLGGQESLSPPQVGVVAESPTAAEFSIYDTAYQEEVDRIRATQGQDATVYLNRRVDNIKQYVADENMVDAPKTSEVKRLPQEGWKELLNRTRQKPVTASEEHMTTSSTQQLGTGVETGEAEHAVLDSTPDIADSGAGTEDTAQGPGPDSSGTACGGLGSFKQISVGILKSMSDKKSS